MVVENSDPNPMLGFFGAFGNELSHKLEHRALEELSLSSSSQSNSEYSDSEGEEILLTAAGTQKYIAQDRSEQSVTVWEERPSKPPRAQATRKKAPGLPPRPQTSKDSSGTVWQNVRGPVWVPSMGLGSIVGIPKKSPSPDRQTEEVEKMIAKKRRKELKKQRAQDQNRNQSSNISSENSFIAIADNPDELPNYDKSMAMLQKKLAHLGKIEQEVQDKMKYQEVEPDRSRFETPPWSDEEKDKEKKAANEATQSTISQENSKHIVNVCEYDDRQDSDSVDLDSLSSSSLDG